MIMVKINIRPDLPQIVTCMQCSCDTDHIPRMKVVSSSAEANLLVAVETP